MASDKTWTDPSAKPSASLERAVRRSESGQLSVSIGDVSKTPSFRRDLEAVTRIRRLGETTRSNR